MTTVVSNNTPDWNEPPTRFARLLDGMPGVALAFLWGLAEGTYFFVVPDVLISLAAMLRPGRAWRHVFAAIVGAMIAGTLLYSCSARNPRQGQAAVTQVPFVRTRMLEQVHASYQKHGMGAIFLGPLTGTPYKIYAVEAPAFVSRGAFLWATIAARAERFLPIWAIFAMVGSRLRRRLRRPSLQLAIGHGCFWAAFYAFYWGRIMLR